MTKSGVPEPREIEGTLREAVAASWGHFRYESGHHGDLWLDLEALFLDARRTHGWAAALAQRAAVCRPEFVCGPLTGGAFVAHSLAAELGAGFVFAERFVPAKGEVRYRVPQSLREAVRGRRVLLVDDVVNAGAALRSTLADLSDCAAELAGLGSLITLGEAASQIAEQRGVPLFALASLERGMWEPGECLLCRSGMPLVDLVAR
ncbi:MAG: phosphoribosyltransferase family protein [Anaerolineae bacterium]|jgi:orotate phosphoribosyltransferase